MAIATDSLSTSRECATSSSIVPIRVDALSEDKTIRIVDTLLFDPTCWPISLYQPLHASVEENVVHIAHTILSDAEVQGMGRTIRHFTGRLDLWNPKLQTAVENQLRPQLWKIASNNTVAYFTPPKDSNNDSAASHWLPISIRLMLDRIVVHEDILWDCNGRLSPFEFAQDMAEELNLPEEATVAIATTIIEQLHGLKMDPTTDQSLSINVVNNPNNNNNSQSNNPSASTTTTAVATSASKSLRGAWLLDTKDQTAIASQVVAQHRSI